MHFKSLELLGFKSFAEKTKLDFEPGVTAIIGPNGCGKSNVADAIRWVLGEQSAKSLRASSMDDVIFNGTDTKEPINFAEINLTLSNEKRILPIDYDEVTISRRIFRSGETEYLLNKTPVRLKDISELLMGTGIGTESYSIIEQGKIDLILSSKPEDRRYVFEEASGITKYKSKKKEALRKLEQTEQNLLRINDIILEVKRQISSIERQARKAERYKTDFDKLKEFEVKLSCLDFRNLKTQEKTYSVESGDLRQREKDIEEENKAVSLKISDYRQSVDEINKKVAELKTRLAEMTSAFDMNVHKIEIDRERIGESRASADMLQKEIGLIETKSKEAAVLIEKLKADLEKVVAEKESREALIAEKEILMSRLSREIDETEDKVKTCKVQTIDYAAKETRIKNELIKLGADIQNRKARQRRLVIEKETVGKELEAVNGILEGIRKEFQDAENKLSGLRSDLESKRRSADAIAEGIRSAEEACAKEENNQVAIRSKIEFLEDLVRKHEGFKSAVKALLLKSQDDKASFGGILGVLADVIKVTKGYEDAVNTFLNDDAQVIITHSDSDIANAINYLRENRLGKASFVSIETLDRLNGARGEAAQIPCQPLKNFLKCEAGFEAALDYFFADAYLVDSIEEGRKYFAGAPAVTLVTKSGTMYERGRVSGGSVSDKDESLLIGRKDRLEEFKTDLKASAERFGSLSEKRAKKNEMGKALEEEIESLGYVIHAEDISLSNIKAKKDAQESGADKIREELEVLKLELEETDQVVGELTAKGEALNAELNDIVKETTTLSLFIDESQGSVAAKRKEKEGLTIEVTTLRTANQSVYKEHENIANNLRKEESGLAELKAASESKAALLKESVEKAAGFENEIAQLKSQNDGLSQEMRVLNEGLARIDKNRSDETDKLSICELQLKDREKELESVRNQVRDLDVKLTEINYKRTNLKERMNQAYKVDLDTVHVELEEIMDINALNAQVTELKERLDKMGPVNLVAIDEHKELEERHSFLVHQQEDLMNAKDSLHKAIQKINKTTKDLFIDAFQKIQAEFKNFFRMLFGGGQAELVLVDDTDVLESGIEIIVRPPGKKLQNIMLLSGGEKALTAIALLFAIFKVKPSPFCVLDEIDAPLDESNINRFSTVLKDFLKISQFIIITHNKRTIELADVMYGITMQERGVSKVVSVKFLDKKKEESKAAPALAQPA